MGKLKLGLSRLSWWQKSVAGTLLGLLTIALGLLTSVLIHGSDLLAPITETSSFRFLTGSEQNSTGKVVYGFLPYWNLSATTLQPELTHLSYFGLTLAGDGSILLREAEGNIEPGYHKLSSDQLETLLEQAKKQGTSFEITVIQFDNDAIVSFLSSEQAQTRFIDQLDSLLLAYPISGINIDIEYTGEVTERLRANYVTFSKKLRTTLDQKYSKITLSMDMYASGASSYQIWDVAALAPHLDYIVVMAYDFHRRSSPLAGPVAPLFGGKELWDQDISLHLEQFLKSVPREKILLGVPFYGYEWQTVSDAPQSQTFPKTGATISFKRIQELLTRKDELDLKEKWNESALSPYVTYNEGGKQYVAYYENSRSLSYKLDFVNQLDLGGIAIWALGYEADSRELWDVIERKF